MAKRSSKAAVDVGERSKTITVSELADLMNNDRLRRKMSWPAYSVLLGVPHVTLYKIFSGERTKPHQTTVFAILTAIEANK